MQGEERKIELWIIGQSDVYSLDAKTRKGKEDFAVELRNVIIKQKERAVTRPVRLSQVNIGETRNLHSFIMSFQSVVYQEQMSTTSGVSSESLRSRRSQFQHSRSLELEDGRLSSRSHSLDPHQDRSSSEADLVESPRYQIH